MLFFAITNSRENIVSGPLFLQRSAKVPDENIKGKGLGVFTGQAGRAKEFQALGHPFSQLVQAKLGLTRLSITLPYFLHVLV